MGRLKNSNSPKSLRRDERRLEAEEAVEARLLVGGLGPIHTGAASTTAALTAVLFVVVVALPATLVEEVAGGADARDQYKRRER